ncbi:MAG: hypothetical protein SNG38_05905 [Rikenellaceae bacterium]
MKQISRMANEVNKLIGTTLLSGNSVYIPKIGSLYTTEDKETKSVCFTPEEQGKSVIELVQERARCTEEQASDIYDRWKTEVTQEDTITINGVAKISAGSAVVSDRFLEKLNAKPVEKPKKEEKTKKKKVDKPKKVKPIKEKKPMNKKGIIVIASLVAVIFIGYLTINSISKSNAEKARIEMIAKEKAAEQKRAADSVSRAQIEAKRIAEAEAKAAANKVPPRFRVVYGVYDLRSNVDVAIASINKRHGAGSAHEYPFGARTMVTIFESESRQECQKFLMENYDTYTNSWIYDAQQ